MPQCSCCGNACDGFYWLCLTAERKSHRLCSDCLMELWSRRNPPSVKLRKAKKKGATLTPGMGTVPMSIGYEIPLDE